MNRKQPNIVVIVADDLGFGDLGIYGNPDVKTPNLDQLAKEGVRLTQHYSASPMCSPARAALLTGKYPHRTGAVDVSTLRGYDRIAETETLLPQWLKQDGYATGMVGKWHNGRDEAKYHPTSRGFDSFLGFCTGGCDYWDWHLDRNGEHVPADGRYLTDVFSQEACEFIDRNHDKPFFLSVAYNAPHKPLQAVEEDLAEFASTGKHTPAVSAVYAMIKRMDRGIGDILETLREHDIEDDTFVIFTSDNGPDFAGEGDSSTHRFNGHFNGSKGMVLEGGIRVPAIVRWPGQIPSNCLGDARIHYTDWLPTLLDVASGGKSADPVPGIDGRSVLNALLQGGEETSERPLFWQWNRFVPIAECNAAMRDGEWKLYYPSIPEAVKSYKLDGKIGGQIMKNPHLTYELVRTPIVREVSSPSAPLLFNVKEDPYEQHDVAETNRARVESMVAELADWFRRMSEESEEAHRLTLA
jgi:arylsulfatase A